jgi:hypothetical protein
MQVTARKTTVDADTRRKVYMAARARKPQDAAKVPHEAFIRNLLKDTLGWPRREQAPESIKAVAREMAAKFKAEEFAKSLETAARRAARAAELAEALRSLELIADTLK